MQRAIPPLSKSDVLTLNGETNKSITYQPFVMGIKTPITFEQELRAKIVTISVNNKMIKQWTNVYRPGDWEHPFFYNEGNLKMEFKWDPDQETAALFLDGKFHDDLPWLTPDFKLDEQELDRYQADLFCDGVKATTEYEPFEWEPHVFLHKMLKSCGNVAPKKILMIYMSHPTTVTNQLFDVLANNAPNDGYEFLHFEKFFKCMDEPMA